ncbi:MAG: hypothetical protein RL160_268 [Bacteroidota bacterium]|jgi:hypothetical protein
MGKIRDILASEEAFQKLYQHLVSGARLSHMHQDARAFVQLQAELRAKAAHKLPSWETLSCLFTRQSLEQCSSELLANYKSTLVRGKRCLDLSGGLGVDAVAFSRVFDEVISVDPDADLHELFLWNAARLGVKNVHRLCADAVEVLEQTDVPADLIYLDPDRRSAQGRRLVGFKHYSPEPLALYKKYANLGRLWLIKLSPLDDLHAIMNACPEVKSIRVISKDAEVKELLLELIPGYTGVTTVEAVFAESGQTCTHLWNPQLPAMAMADKVLDWLFDPASALIKSGYLKQARHRLEPLNVAGTLWTAPARERLPGRWIQVLHVARERSLRKCGRILQELGIDAALVKAKSYHLSSEEVRKVLKLAEGQEYAVYFVGQGKSSLMMVGKIV